MVEEGTADAVKKSTEAAKAAADATVLNHPVIGDLSDKYGEVVAQYGGGGSACKCCCKCNKKRTRRKKRSKRRNTKAKRR
jgi:hypothetical protein